MDYVKDGTLTIQARTIKEVNSIDRVVVYADGCQREYLMPLPTVEERKEGRWIDTDYINLQLDTYLASCSECGYQMNVHNNRGYFKYCPNCGAKMYEDDRDIYVLNKGE